MKEIAYTGIGRNTLFTGLISHAAAFLAAMMAASGREYFFGIVFFFSCFLFIIGAFAELKNRGCRPLIDWRFYVIVAVTVFPFLGPLVIMGLLYSIPKSGETQNNGLSGLLPAFFRLRANGLVLFLLLVFLFILFVFTGSQDDPYFKRSHRNDPHRNLPKSVAAADHHRDCVQTVKIFSRRDR
ncbi:MAG: hypothetical protein CVU71_03560 [Deltaproteobacteria bacterium HGW-Deltaproteobacteria-6]|jgi:hypothetical protein|nr:MAG: hypothetical protein CVU71_03560 [Deltaproteobacteria bacterium HGW-Deltaproteobacteria-6]